MYIALQSGKNTSSRAIRIFFRYLMLIVVTLNKVLKEYMWHQQKQSVTDGHTDHVQQTKWSLHMWRFALLAPNKKVWKFMSFLHAVHVRQSMSIHGHQIYQYDPTNTFDGDSISLNWQQSTLHDLWICCVGIDFYFLEVNRGACISVIKGKT